MIRKTTILLVTAAAFLVIGQREAFADGVILAAGHGNLTVDGGRRTFSFVVVEFDDGTVIGQA